MRHKGSLSSAFDACGRRACPSHRTARAQLAPHNVAGPSRLPMTASSAPPSPPPIPPIRPREVSSSTSALSSSFDRHLRSVPQRVHSHHLSFLYPPSCLEFSHNTFARSKSSLAPTSAVAAAAAAAAQQQSLTTHDDNQPHFPRQQQPEFSFLRHHYEPPHHFIDHPPSKDIIHQDAHSHLEAETLASEAIQDEVSSALPASNHLQTSVAALSSLRRKCSALRRSVQHGQITDADALVKQCRRLVLQSCRMTSRFHSRAARAFVSETVSDCALYLSAAGQPIAAANVIRQLLVKLGWSPRPALEVESNLRDQGTSATSHEAGPSVASPSPAGLLLITQQVISQLTLAPSPYSPRPTRRFESQQHLDAAISLASAMHISQMARSTASQTALIRAMIASGQPFLAVQTFAAELRAWWNAHRQVRRPHSLLRRQAALIVEIGKPSSQALREITRSLQQLEELLTRIRPDLLSQLSEHEQHALQTKRGEYADSLVELLRLVRGGRLPLPPVASAPEIAWILSACCRFEKTTLLDNPTADLDAAEKRKLQDAAQLIRYFLGEYMRSLPDGQTRSAGSLLIGGNPVVRPPLGVAVYNQLLHYALSVLRSPSTCREVFQHMTQHRQPPLEPDAVTFNTILRQATTQRYEALARAVMTTTRPEQPQLGLATVPGQSVPSKNATLEAGTVEIASQPIRPMLQQIDNAVAQADSYRLVSLLQYVTASSMFLRRYRHEPGHVSVKELVMRIYPALDKKRHGRQRAVHPHQPHRDAALRPKANQASRHAILNPHVLTATLNLAAKAGKTGLVLRVWRLIKRTSLQSELQSPTNDVAAAPWKIPVEAATILMSVLANETAKAPKAMQVQRARRQRLSLSRSRIAPQRSSKLTAHRQYARGWNIVASLRGRSIAGGLRLNESISRGIGELGEGLRWRAAQLLAKREYAFLVYHWQMSQKLLSWRRKRVEGWLRKDGSETLPIVAAADAEEASRVQPDSRLYDALLDVFGRRAGMVQRSRKHRCRSEILSQLRRGYKRAADESSSSPLWSADTGTSQTRPEAIGAGTASLESISEQPDRVTLVDNLRLSTTSQLLEAVVARIGWNSRGRRTSLPPDAFLVLILLDMEALGVEIPIAYRWVLTHCAIATADTDTKVTIPDLLQNDRSERKSKAEMGAFSPYRGPRIKTVGLIARRRNSALAEKKAEEKANKS